MWPLSPLSGPLVWVGGTTSPPVNFICRVTSGPVVALASGATTARVAVVVGRLPALDAGVTFLLEPQAAKPTSPTSMTDTRTAAVRLRRIMVLLLMAQGCRGWRPAGHRRRRWRIR